MKFLLYFSDFIVPFTMFYIVVYGFFNRTDVYESFLKGVKEGFQIVIEIAPTMIALLVSIGIFRASGALDSFSELLAPAGKLLHIPVEVIPVFIVRIFSSSAAVSFVLDIFKEYGPDSRLDCLNHDELYRDGNLYNYDLLHECKYKKNTLDFAGSDVCDDSRSGGERGNNGIDYVI